MSLMVIQKKGKQVIFERMESSMPRQNTKYEQELEGNRNMGRNPQTERERERYYNRYTLHNEKAQKTFCQSIVWVNVNIHVYNIYIQ